MTIEAGKVQLRNLVKELILESIGKQAFEKHLFRPASTATKQTETVFYEKSSWPSQLDAKRCFL